jgi:hypothetical protein
MGADIQYENGNIHTPVVVLGDDPATEGNVLVSRLATAVSVPKASLNAEEGTPNVDEEGNPVEATEDKTEDETDAES